MLIVLCYTCSYVVQWCTEAAANLIPSPDEQTSANIAQVLSSPKAAVLTQYDRNARIEKLFFEAFLHDKATSRFNAVVLACFAPVGDRDDIPRAQQALANLGQSKLLTFVGCGLQAFCDTTVLTESRSEEKCLCRGVCRV